MIGVIGGWREAQVLRGRQRERALLEKLITDVRACWSRVLVLRGEAETGKTALLDVVALGRLERPRAQTAFPSTSAGDSVPLLLDVAQRLQPLDPPAGHETYLEALSAGIQAGRLCEEATRLAAEAAAHTAGTPTAATGLRQRDLQAAQRGQRADFNRLKQRVAGRPSRLAGIPISAACHRIR